jgi:hypothetical protein
VTHCHHVAVMVRQLMASPVLRRRLSAAFEMELTEQHLDRLAILAGVHDLGKALKGFQDKLEQTPLTSRGHVAEALAVLTNNGDARNAIRLPLLSEWSSASLTHFTSQSVTTESQSRTIESGPIWLSSNSLSLEPDTVTTR